LDNKELIRRCIRIFHISRKPTGPEFSQVARITALGMALFGLVGFIISVISSFIR
jgi:protein translocase SEC61 complex gamma subunit